jgi:phage tail sheath protein FI
MPFQLSPGVAVVEKDFTSIVPAVSTSIGGFAGAFQWGPIEAPTTIPNETDLVRKFGKPVDGNADSFFTAANFLSYTNNMLVVRSDASGLKNAVATKSGSVESVTIDVAGDGYTTVPDVTVGAPDIAGGVQAVITASLSGGGVTAIPVTSGGTGYTTATVNIAAPEVAGGAQATASANIDAGVITSITIDKPGSGYTTAPVVTVTGDGSGIVLGTVTIESSSIASLTITEAGSGYSSAPTITIDDQAGVQAEASASITTAGVKIKNNDSYITSYSAGEGLFGEFAAKYAGEMGNSLQVVMMDSSSWNNAAPAYKAQFDSAPGTSDYATNGGGSADELHILVIDQDGVFTGSAGTVLEKFAYVSKASDAKKGDGTNNYYKNVLNSRSEYVYWMDHPTAGTNWGTAAAGTTFAGLGASGTIDRSLTGGVDDYAVSDGNLIASWLLLADDAAYDVSLLPLGKVSTTVAVSVINNVAEARKDCMAFVSPINTSDNEFIIGNGSTATDAMIDYRDALPSTSYAAMDSGAKYQYDRYNDKYRFVPLNGDIAGLAARTDYTNDAWWSPAGLNRGQVKNVVKLACNPTKADRDNLYKAGINPVVTFPGDGTVLFGDKTLLSKPSAFDRINVRRLFIVLEKAIATAAKFQLFEFNDSFTRAQFRNLVEPFLRDVQGRRGVTDFLVKCDDSNNTGEVIDRNEFVADIFVKPARSINFITLNFVAARSGVSFSELTG